MPYEGHSSSILHKMKTQPESHRDVLKRRKILYEQKISQERHAMEFGGMPIAPPVESHNIPKRSRTDRLADWEAILAEIERDLIDV